MKHIRIAELVENLENIDQIISMHKETTRNQSMIRQYEFKRMELLQKLNELLKTYNIRLEVNEPA